MIVIRNHINEQFRLYNLHILVYHALWSKLHFEWTDLTDLLSMQNFVKSCSSYLESTASLHYTDFVLKERYIRKVFKVSKKSSIPEW